MKNAYGWVLQRLNGDKNAFAIEYVPVKSSTNKRISTKMECARDDHPAKDAESVGKELEPANRFRTNAGVATSHCCPYACVLAPGIVNGK
jgi:hypothetical protein